MLLTGTLALLVLLIPNAELCECDARDKEWLQGKLVPKSLCTSPQIIEVDVTGVDDGPEEMLDYKVQVINVLRGSLNKEQNKGSVLVPLAEPPCYEDFIMEKGQKYVLAVDTIGSHMVLNHCNFAADVRDLTSIERTAIINGCYR